MDVRQGTTHLELPTYIQPHPIISPHTGRPGTQDTTMAAKDVIPDFLAEQRDAAPEDLQPFFLEFEDLWERKLWHQLTDSLVRFFNEPTGAPQRLPLYKTFILKFADKINQLRLVELALKAATQCPGGSSILGILVRPSPVDSIPLTPS